MFLEVHLQIYHILLMYQSSKYTHEHIDIVLENTDTCMQFRKHIHVLFHLLCATAFQGDCSTNNFTSWIKALSWQRGMGNSAKLGGMLCRPTQDKWVIVQSSDKTWSTEEGNGNPLQYLCRKNPMNRIKRQKDMTLKMSPCPEVGRCLVCYGGKAEGNY